MRDLRQTWRKSLLQKWLSSDRNHAAIAVQTGLQDGIKDSLVNKSARCISNLPTLMKKLSLLEECTRLLVLVGVDHFRRPSFPHLRNKIQGLRHSDIAIWTESASKRARRWRMVSKLRIKWASPQHMVKWGMLGASTVWTTHVTLVIKKFLSTRPNNFKSFENANWTNAVCFFYFCQKEGPQDARNSERKQDGHTSSFATWPSPPPPRSKIQNPNGPFGI